MTSSKSIRLLFAFSALTAVTVAASSAQAAGFYLQEDSVSGMGAAFSGSTTNIKDASTVYFNPAGMTDLDRAQISAGAHLLIPKSSLKNTGSTLFGAPVGGDSGGNPYSPTPVPNLYAAAPISNDLWAGVGFNAPFGLANDYENTSFARYDSTYTSLQVYNLSTVLAYKINPMISIGGGIDFQYADATLRNAVSGLPGTQAYQELKGSDLGFGANIGVKIKPTPTTTVGLTYRTNEEMKLDGDISVRGTSGAVLPFSTPGKAKLALPDIAAIGLTQEIKPGLRAMANVTWYGWSKFDEIRAISDNGAIDNTTEQGYRNTVGMAFGAEYDLNPAWTLRAGYQYDPTPTTDEFRTSRTPDGNRNWFTAGATYKINDTMSVDMAAAYIHIGDESIDVTRNNGFAVVSADTSGHVEIVSAALNYKF